MKRLWIFVLITGIAIAAVSVFQYLTRLGEGDLAPGFELISIDSRSVSLSGYKGRPVLLHFWASWCGPCRQEFPALSRLQRDFAKDGLAVLAVSEDKEIAAVRAFVDFARPDFTVLLDDEGRVADAYQSWAVPETMLIDGRGTIVWRHAGPVDWDSRKARERVRELTGG